jgi:hypothetical protein
MSCTAVVALPVTAHHSDTIAQTHACMLVISLITSVYYTITLRHLCHTFERTAGSKLDAYQHPPARDPSAKIPFYKRKERRRSSELINSENMAVIVALQVLVTCSLYRSVYCSNVAAIAHFTFR